MDTAFAELPLALFTTLVLVGSGCFILQVFAIVNTDASLCSYPTKSGKLDMFSLVPLLFVIVGFIAAFRHLASPLNAPLALSRLGYSPLSNELVVGLVFLLMGIVYCILSSQDKLSVFLRKGFAIALGILGVLFALFTGLAYFIDTIISWYTPLTVVETLGFSLFAGGELCLLLLDFGSDNKMLRNSKFYTRVLIALVAGAVLGFGALLSQVVMVSGLETSMVSGEVVVKGVISYLVISVLCTIISLMLLISRKILPRVHSGVLPLGCLLALIAVFIARLVFYAIQMSAAL